jgi:hypothetical protein
MTKLWFGILGIALGGIFTYVVGPYVQAHLAKERDLCWIERNRMTKAHELVDDIDAYVRNQKEISPANLVELRGKASTAERYVRTNRAECR